MTVVFQAKRPRACVCVCVGVGGGGWVCAVLLCSEGLTPQLSVQQQSQAAGSGPASSQSVPSWRSSGLGKAGVTSQLSQRLGDEITFHTMHTHTQRNKKSTSPFYSPLWVRLSLSLSVPLSFLSFLIFQPCPGGLALPCCISSSDVTSLVSPIDSDLPHAKLKSRNKQ